MSKRMTETQIVAILKEAEAGIKVGGFRHLSPEGKIIASNRHIQALQINYRRPSSIISDVSLAD